MLEPNDAESVADNADEACKSDYFSDEGDVKNETAKSDDTVSSKRKPDDTDNFECKKIKPSETSSNKTSSISSPTDQPNTSEFVRAGSVASDNSDEFVDASDVLEPPLIQEKTSQNSTDTTDSCTMKSPPIVDTSKSNIFDPEVPKVKDNKFNKRLPTFADDPLDRFNSSAMRRGLTKETEPVKPIDFNFDLGDKDRNEPRNENKTVKKVKLNRSKFFSQDKPKFSDESSSDSNSKFNTSTSPVKSGVPPPPQNKERNFIGINNTVDDKLNKTPVEEKKSTSVEPPSVTNKNEKVQIDVKSVPTSDTGIKITSSVLKANIKIPQVTIPILKLPPHLVERHGIANQKDTTPKPAISNITKDEPIDKPELDKQLQKVEKESEPIQSDQEPIKSTDDVDKMVITENTSPENHQNQLPSEKSSPQITKEITPELDQAEKFEDVISQSKDDETLQNSNAPNETILDTKGPENDPQHTEKLNNDEIQSTLDIASKSPEIIPESSSMKNVPLTDVAISNSETSSIQQPSIIVEQPLDTPKPSESVSQSLPEPEKSIEEPNPQQTESTIKDVQPEPQTVENVDSSSDLEDHHEDKSEPELSNEESEEEGEEEMEEEEEEEEIIHEEEVYLEDRLPIYHSQPDPESPQRENSPSPEPVQVDDSDDVMEVDTEANQPVESSKPPSPPEPDIVSAYDNIQNIEDIPMEVDDDQKIPSSSSDGPSLDDQTKPKELSKLEQALIGKKKRLEVQVPEMREEEVKNIANVIEEPKENEEAKEKIKLHLSLQGDKVSIKKGPLDAEGVVRVKRQYRKRRLEDLKAADKTYKLRNRTIKKDEEGNEAQSNGTVQVSNAKETLSEVSVVVERKIVPPTRPSEPVTIDLDDSDSCGEVPKQPATKIQPIKLKIGKNANVTIESGPPRTEIVDDARKKDSIPNYMEQAATAWSGPDLQRVERLLKESNITITPVIPKEPAPQVTPCVIKPIPKEKPAIMVPKFSTPSSVITNAASLQSTTAAVTPILKERDDQPTDVTPTKTQPADSPSNEDPLLKFKMNRPEGVDITPVSSGRQIDVRSEIRKKLASVEKKMPQSGKESNDSESESDSKSKSKPVPDLLPANFPTPEILQNLASSLGVNTTAESESSDGKKPDIDPAFLPLLQTLPKKRGRPTKAMVAAREALKQSQEVALENLRQLASQKTEEAGELMSRFPIPLFDMTDPENPFKPKRGRKSRSERLDKSDGDQSAVEDPVMDPIREQEEIKRLEEERIKKEEEKERRNEIRRQKARERNDLVKAKRLRQKMKAEERQKRMQEKRRKLQEEKKKLEEEIKNLPQSLPGFDDETRMSAENSQLQTTSYSIGMGDEDSSNATTEFSQRVKKSRMEVTDMDSKDLTVDQIAEYQWPIQGGDLYMIQEQVSNYLGVKSFKRKYPDIKRRPVDSEERAYLVDSGLVSESLCDLGLTAVSSAELLDIMCADFPDKYEELRRYMREKQMKELSFKQKAWANGLGYKLLMADGTKQDLKKRAMDSASNWNSALNKSRSEDRRCAMDLQTFIVHYPKNRTRKMSMSTPKMGSYPVSILPGQFCDFYKNYTSTELRYMPINTVLYGPLKPHDVNIVGDGSQTDSDDTSSSDESSTTSEGTQATEDTIEDTDKDMSVDESSQIDKTHEMNLIKEAMSMELSENTRELIMDEAAKILCKVCLGNMARNKENVPEVLICCSQCSSTSHPTCLDLSLDMVPHIKKYPWQCPDCKICARCKTNTDEDKMLFCDTCDRGYHIYCVGLRKVPSGNWQCQECVSVEHNICINSSTVREVFKEPGLIEIQDG